MSRSKIGAVILAGGFGTRIRELYPEVPKPMIEVAGRPFVEWIIRYLARQGISEVCLSTGYKAEVIEDYFAGAPIEGIVTHCVREEKPLGTAGGFLFSAPKVTHKEIVLATNGDSLVLADLSPAIQMLASNKADAVIVGRFMEDASNFGTLEFDADSRLTGFVEKRPGAGIINAGIYLFPSSSLPHFTEKRPLSFELELFPDLLAADKRIFVARTDAPFIDIGRPETVVEAEAFVLQYSDYFQK